MPERLLEQASDVIRGVSSEAWQLAEAGLRRKRRTIARFIKAAMLSLLAMIAIPLSLVTAGILIDSEEGWWRGLVASPIAVLLAWIGLALWAFRRPRIQAPAGSDLVRLPARTEAWLEYEGRSLPPGAQRYLDRITLHLQALTPQLQALEPRSAPALEIGRLLGEELPELVRGYHNVPKAFRRQPLNGGPSPDRQIVDGLATVSEAVERLHSELASRDLRALATQQRYLDLKYKGDDDKLK
jgi:hypothetical protein